MPDFTEDYLRSIDIHELLPQQEPFVMVTCLTHYDAETSVSQTTIGPDNIFVDNGYFSASGMMENMAQTCAARIGFYNKYVLHKDVQLGFIGAVRNYEVHELAPEASVIETRIDIMEEVFGMTLTRAEVRLEGRVIATAEIKLSVRSMEQ